jgi:TonB-dependent SusC/RagA subfamily outer membrane receptor
MAIAVTAGGESGGRLNDTAPEHIESIDIVKGPSAATLYGTDAANGVVLTTNKARNRKTSALDYVRGQRAATNQPQRIPIQRFWLGPHVRRPDDFFCMLPTIALGSRAQDSVTKFDPLRVGSLTPLGTGNQGIRCVAGVRRYLKYAIL